MADDCRQLHRPLTGASWNHYPSPASSDRLSHCPPVHVQFRAARGPALYPIRQAGIGPDMAFGCCVALLQTNRTDQSVCLPACRHVSSAILRSGSCGRQGMRGPLVGRRRDPTQRNRSTSDRQSSRRCSYLAAAKQHRVSFRLINPSWLRLPRPSHRHPTTLAPLFVPPVSQLPPSTNCPTRTSPPRTAALAGAF